MLHRPKKILFIHPNFPAQFNLIARHLANRGDEVRVVTSCHNQKAIDPSFKVERYTAIRSSEAKYDLVKDFETKAIRAESCLNLFLEILESGYYPEIVFYHPSWGEALFLREVWPASLLIAYCEHFPSEKNSDIDFAREKELAPHGRDYLKAKLKKFNYLINLMDCDLGISPTYFQKSTFPSEFQSKIRVVHEGVDTDYFRPKSDAILSLQYHGRNITLSRKDEVITYINRNMEPYRGIHIFLEILPKILRDRPNAVVLIIGSPSSGYGPSPAKTIHGSKTWFDIFWSRMNNSLTNEQLSRVLFLGTIGLEHYRLCLQVSSCHVHLSYPFTLSWSFMEAMSTGLPIVSSNSEAVREMAEDGEHAMLVDFYDVDSVVTQCIELLKDRDLAVALGTRAREEIVNNYDAGTVSTPRLVSIIDDLTLSKS